KAPEATEESVAQFARRRLGREFVDYVIDPFVAGVYAGDPDELSVAAAFPRLHALEQQHGSILKGQLRGARERKADRQKASAAGTSFSFVDGMQTLTDALAEQIERIECGITVVRVIPDAEGTWTVEATQAGAAVARRARAVILA